MQKPVQIRLRLQKPVIRPPHVFGLLCGEEVKSRGLGGVTAKEKISHEQVQAVRAAAPLTAETIARTFQRARALAPLGQVREVAPGR